MLYVEFTPEHYVNVGEIVQLVKASIIVISVHLEISTLFVVMTVTFRVLRCLLKWRLNPAGFGTQKECRFNRAGNRYKD